MTVVAECEIQIYGDFKIGLTQFYYRKFKHKVFWFKKQFLVACLMSLTIFQSFFCSHQIACPTAKKIFILNKQHRFSRNIIKKLSLFS
jgi:hypothetical protein